MDSVTCAKCGEVRVLCQSARADGIQQPRFCKPCVMRANQTGDWDADGTYWVRQLIELQDWRSLKLLSAQVREKHHD